MSRSTLLSIAVGFRTLRVNPLRTVLSTLGVIIGVAALVAVLALGDGMEQYARDEIAATNTLLSVQLVPVMGREVDGIFIPDTTAPRFTVAQAESLAALPGVAMASMYSAAPAMAAYDSVQHAAIVRGSLASLRARDGLALARGRFYDENEVRSGARVTVLSDSLARALARGSSPARLVGDSIVLHGRALAVVGILARVEQRRGQPPERPTAYVPISIAAEHQMAAGAPPRPNIVLTAREIEDVKPLRDGVEQWIAAAHPEWGARVDVRIDERGDKAQQGILVFKLLMGAMTGISLLVGGIGIMNVLLASVVERTREIGIRKATGARQRDILVQFLSESVAISGLGSAIGLGVGFTGAVAVTALMRRLTEAPVQAGFSLSTFMVAAIAAVSVGLVFGTYPALRAARLSPVEAMHHE